MHQEQESRIRIQAACPITGFTIAEGGAHPDAASNENGGVAVGPSCWVDVDRSIGTVSSDRNGAMLSQLPHHFLHPDQMLFYK